MKLIATPSTVDLSLILRGIFASAVVAWHTFGYRLDIPALDFINIPGRVSVWMFFGLSGYVIGYGFFAGRYDYRFHGLGPYFLRRIFRVMPLFWVASLAAFTFAYLGGRPIHDILSEAPNALFALQWSHVQYPVGVFWTLGIEIQYYLIAPLFVSVFVQNGPRWLLLAIGVWTLLWLIYGSTADNRTLLGNLQHFVVGMIVARAYVDGMLDRILAKVSASTFISLGATAIVAANAIYHRGDFWSREATFLVDLAIAALLLAHCSIERRRLSGNIATVSLMVVGVLAYGIYAWHGVLLTFFPDLGESFLLTYLLSFTLALVSFASIESRLIGLARQLSNRMKYRAATQHD